MPEFCTCGAQLPPDALFCHRCGKPQRDLPGAAVEIPAAEARAPVEAPAPAPLNFHNAVAVRVGFLAASLAAFLSTLPWINLGFVIWWLAAGFYAVHLYRRRTGQLLTVRSGARLGWITGVLTFVIFTVVFTLSLMLGDFAGMLRQRVSDMSAQDRQMQQAAEILASPTGLAVFMLLFLFFMFVFVTVICTAGGALGAKILEKD
ncbi:MAG: zinc ribbon domain-containing protein [Bryobacteraceae bacterium]